MSDTSINSELIVIGAGIAGMAAAIFAVTQGISTVLVGMPNTIRFASGLLDLMAVYPVSEQKCWENPWEVIQILRQESSKHPYSGITDDEIKDSMDKFISFLTDAGIPYFHQANRNLNIVTSIGTIKTTYAIPQSMWNGIQALENKDDCLLVDFYGFKGYSALQIKETNKNKWPMLRTRSVSFPGISGDLYAESLAKELDFPEARKRLIENILPHIDNSRALGLPPILGIHRTKEAIADLEKNIGIPVFEIPGLPPSIPGLRIKTALENELPKHGGLTIFQQSVLKARWIQKEGFTFEIGQQNQIRTIVKSKGAILATGRFLGKGLYADRKAIRETIFDLPVYQPEDRSKWHNNELFDPRGHSINLSGLEIDELFRPIDKQGRPAFKRLFAAGSILAHQDWTRMKCGAGLSIASAYKAVKSFLQNINS